MSARRRRRRVEPTEEWEGLLPLFEWPEQENYEVIRPLVLFGESVAGRAKETGVSERSLYRGLDRFEASGMESLFDSGKAKRQRLPPAMRRFIVELKAEHPRLNTSEMANIVYVRFGRRPDVRTIGRVLDEYPLPLKILKRFSPYHQTPEPKERRMAIVKLHAEGWSVKAMASYLKTSKPTVYRAAQVDPRGHGGSRRQEEGSEKRGEKGGPRSHRGRQEAAAESGPRRVSRPRCPGPDRHPLESSHLRADTRAQPQALRLRQTQEWWRREEGDALRLRKTP